MEGILADVSNTSRRIKRPVTITAFGKSRAERSIFTDDLPYFLNFVSFIYSHSINN